MGVENITKAAIFKSFLELSYYNPQLLLTVVFNIFIRQALTDDFWGLRKNMNSAFLLNRDKLKKAKTKTKTKSNGLRSLKGKKQIHVSAGLIFALIVLLNE